MKKLSCLVPLLALALLVTGCGSQKNTKETPAKTTTQTTQKPTKATTKPTTISSTELGKLVQNIYATTSKDARTHQNYFAHDKAGFMRIGNVAKPIVNNTLSSRTNQKVTMSFFVGDYHNNGFLHCMTNRDDVNILYVADVEGRSSTIVLLYGGNATYLINDYRQKGKKPFDQDGFATGSGACLSTGTHPQALQTVSL